MLPDGDSRDADNMSEQSDRLEQAVAIVQNSDMQEDDRAYCLRALLYAMIYQQRTDRQDEWQQEPGVMLAELLGVTAFIIVVAHSHVTAPTALWVGFWAAMLLMWFYQGDML